MDRTKYNARGSITIEAAIVLPVFICVIISLAMLIKLVYIHDIMQHSIDEAANELAAYAYIYHISDIKDIDDGIQDNLGDNAARVEGHIGAVVDAFDALESAYTSGSDYIEEVDRLVSSETSFISKANQIINQA
ncbi:MAG: TadE-like protein, partial [Clostridia bacterium]|nr:TadE-like protein [Clostridia bacterium]